MASGMTVTLRINGDGSAAVEAVRKVGNETEKTGKKMKDSFDSAGAGFCARAVRAAGDFAIR
jgi:hypothetical protein